MHTSSFRSSPRLLKLWRDINVRYFGSRLQEPNSIGWLDLTDAPDLVENFGYYHATQRSIALSHRFEYSEAEILACELIATNAELSHEEKKAQLAELNAYEIVFRLLVHEMVHQAAHQAGQSPSTHGQIFLQQASAVANALGIPVPTLEDAQEWPGIKVFLAHEIKAGRVKV